MYLLQWFTAFACFGLPVLSAPSDAIANHLTKRAPVPPTRDPFYTAPAGFESKAPGTILKRRKVPYPITTPDGNEVKNVNASYQILYRSTDSLGKPQAVVTTLLIPNNADPNKYLSYQIAYDSAFINCNPSYTLQQGSKTHDNTTSNIEILLISAALNNGWYVSTPDYEGDKAAFTAGPQSGQATLDNIRAVLSSSSFTKISPKARTAMWGYSGGSLASEWAAELQPDYAPELTNFVGVAAGGLVPNITSIVYYVNKTPSVGLVPLGILGLGNGYPNLSRYIDNHLVPAKAKKFKFAQKHCLFPTQDEFSGDDIFSYFKNGAGTLTDPIPKSILRIAGEQGLRATPKMPLYFYKGGKDEVSPIADSDKLVKKFCRKGARITYIRDLGATHQGLAISGFPGALNWLKDRLDGKTVSDQCNTQTTPAAMTADDSKLMGEDVFKAIKDVPGFH